MKSLRLIASAMLAAGMMAGQPAAFATDSPPIEAVQPSNSLPTTHPLGDPLKDAVAAIERAPDPSSAVAAYARGAPLDRDGVTLERAYIQRLVTLGLPEMAEAQARDLSQRRPDDGMAMAVVAYTDARKGNTIAAMQEILIADRQANDDPFVRRTAGQLMAYYDYRADRTRIDASVRASLEQMRNRLRGQAGYADAYDKASDAYAQGEAPPIPTQPGAAADAPPPDDVVPAPPPYIGPTAVYNYTYNTYAADAAPYTDPFACSYAAYPWWPSWWGWGPSLVVIDRSFSHRHGFGGHDFDRHDFGRHDFDRHDGRFGVSGFANGSFANRSVGVQRSLPAPSFRSAPAFRSSPAPRFAPRMNTLPSRGGSFGGRTGGFGGGGGRMGGDGSMGGGGGGGRR